MVAAAWLIALAGMTQALPGSPRSCAGAVAFRSVDREVPGPARQHVFQNGWPVPLNIGWIDADGHRVDLGTIAPGQTRSLQTYVGHVFVLTDRRGKCRAAVHIDEVFTGTYVGTSRYRPVTMRGWHAYVDRALDPAGEPARTAIATLETMLRNAEAALPAAALAQVRRTPIFLLHHSGWGGMYHPDVGWLVEHGRTVEMTNAIELSDAEAFIDTAGHQPGAMLHELAHAYHRQLPDADRAAIDAAYRHAMTAGLYRAVRREDGSAGPAYASSNADEYFAELSEAHFGRNDFFPFTRAELATYDPDGEALLARLWR